MPRKKKSTAKSQLPLRIIPLGGCTEIGLNMTIVEYGEDILVIDCGQMFPDEDMPGVDLVVPDIAYLEERRERIRGIVLTHGHEDHIGGLPYLLPKLNAPVYGTSLTLGLLKVKLAEFGLSETAMLHEVAHRQPQQLGAFSVEWTSVTHSIPDASCLLVRTPLGLLVHSGDYKIDYAPITGADFDFHSLAKSGEEQPLVLLADSTNADRPGPTPSESAVIAPLERYFQDTVGALIIATFSSALHRVQIILDLAEEHGRKVFISGLNMERNIKIAAELGFLDVPPGLLHPIKQYASVPPRKRLALTTGSQGEPLSGLSRMALDDHKQVKVQPDDTVILSARIIPGNERTIFRMINHFYRRGARVIYGAQERVHSSGHAYQDDMRQLLSLVQPRNLIPVHGELRQRIAHRALAVELGLPPEDIFVPNNGEVLEIAPNGAAKLLNEPVEAGRVLVDGGVGDVHEVVLRDRRYLAEDGVVLVLLVINRSTGLLLTDPEIVSRGFVYMDESEELINRMKDVVLETLESVEQETREEGPVVNEAVRRALRRFLKKETQKFPVILPVITEI